MLLVFKRQNFFDDLAQYVANVISVYRQREFLKLFSRYLIVDPDSGVRKKRFAAVGQLKDGKLVVDFFQQASGHFMIHLK